jgi:dipeptidyl aminopeptidase/acylaminoacyl peptidase
MKHIRKITIPFFFLLVIVASGCSVKEGDEILVRKANYRLAKRFTVSKVQEMIFDVAVQPFWLDVGNRFWYVLIKSRGFDFYLVDCKTGKKQAIPVAVKPVSKQVYTFTVEGHDYRYNAVTRQITPQKPGTPSRWNDWDTVSPDGSRSVFASDHNIYIRYDDASRPKKQITFDGKCFYGYDRPPDYTYTNVRPQQNRDMPSTASATWSPDSRKLFLFREDARHLADLWVINSLSQPRPDLITYKSRLPGEKRRTFDLSTYDLARDTLISIRSKKWPEQSYPYYAWSIDSKRFYLARMRPDQKCCEVLVVNPQTGETRVLFEETLDGQVLIQPIIELPDSGGYLWWSRRSGFGHYYRYDVQGTCIGPVTHGEFTVEKIVDIHYKTGTIFFTACGRETNRHPYYTHLYRTELNGETICLLTPEDTHHEIFLSPNGRFFVDNSSTVETPTRSVLRNADGELILELERLNVSPLESAGWKKPGIFKVKADDGNTDLWGVMWKPFYFDPGKRYPIITEVYPGPQDEAIPLTFMQGLLNNNVHLAQYGFIVVHFGNRGGSYKRSLKYSNFHRGNLRDFPLADNKAAIERLAEIHSFIDMKRVGIWGGSSGGFMAVSAMLTYPDFYKVGVARSGQHDPCIYSGWWSDYFQGADCQSTKGENRWLTCVPPGNLKLARKLKGHLLILHSEMDTNVHPAHSARLVDSLMAAGKRFDYFVVPGGGHGWSHNWPYIQRMIWTYFVHHLMGDGRVSVDMFDDF